MTGTGLALTQEAVPAARALPDMSQAEAHPHWPVLARVPLLLVVRVPVPRFTVRDLLALEAGQVLGTTWAPADDVPMCLRNVQVGWCEFEVVEAKLAVRLTRLA